MCIEKIKKKRPNILFLLADDQRFDTIHTLGNSDIITPYLDQLVERGTSFLNAHIPGGTSAAICMPSRAMLNTGRTLFHIENEGQNIPCEHPTLGETLAKEGYMSYGIGKWHNGTNAYARSFKQGANIFFGGMWDHFNVPVCDYHESGEYSNVIKYIPNFFQSNQVVHMHADKIQAGKHSTEMMCEATINFIENHNTKDPFYMYVSFLAPHDPRQMPEKFQGIYNPKNIKVPENFMEVHPIDYGIMDMRDEVLNSYPRTPESIQQHVADYYAMITHLDDAIGRITQKLKEKGLYEDTIIIFAGDNGLGLGQHGLMGKQNLYEHSIRVPLIFAGPSIPQNQKVNELVYLMDIYPTLVELIGASIPDTVEGKSFYRVMKEGSSGRDDLYLAYTDKIRGVKNKQYKLIEYRTEDVKATQLFNLEKDPLETQNLVEKKEYSVVLDKMRKKLYEFKEDWDDEKHPLGNKFWSRY